MVCSTINIMVIADFIFELDSTEIRFVKIVVVYWMDSKFRLALHQPSDFPHFIVNSYDVMVAK